MSIGVEDRTLPSSITTFTPPGAPGTSGYQISIKQEHRDVPVCAHAHAVRGRQLYKVETHIVKNTKPRQMKDNLRKRGGAKRKIPEKHINVNKKYLRW